MQSNLQTKKGIQDLIKKIRALQSNQRIRGMVEARMNEFKAVYEMDSTKWYEELVYCLLTAFGSALMGQKCVDALCCNNIIFKGTQDEIQQCLVEAGHRFPNKRAEYIYNTQNLAPIIKEKIQSFNDSKKAREWLVENVKGLGWKEASHYLRNIGYFDLAIIDRHIMNNLREHHIIQLDPKKGLSKKQYLAVEKVLEDIADELRMPPGELDLYMWYRKTGKVLK
jgi:N-glycosylase/DNA lyase